MKKENSEEDLIPIRTGCCGYTLYDRIEDQHANNRRKHKEYMKEMTRINKNLNIREEQLVNKMKNEKFLANEEKKNRILREKAEAVIVRLSAELKHAYDNNLLTFAERKKLRNNITA